MRKNLPAFDLTEHATKSARAICNLDHAVGDHRDRCPCPDHHCRRLVPNSMSYATALPSPARARRSYANPGAPRSKASQPATPATNPGVLAGFSLGGVCPGPLRPHASDRWPAGSVARAEPLRALRAVNSLAVTRAIAFHPFARRTGLFRRALHLGFGLSGLLRFIANLVILSSCNRVRSCFLPGRSCWPS